jgi:outer membrane protein assembly factor BamB
MPSSSPRLALVLVLALPLALPAAGIQPQRWTHTAEADFEPGEVDGTVVTNLGDVKLAAATQTIDELPDGVTILYDIEVVNGVTYLAAGPEATVLKVADGKAEQVARFEGEQVFALDQLDGVLIAALSGNESRIVHLGDGEPRVMAKLPTARFLWDLLPAGDGFFVATGPEGKVYHAEAEGVTEVLDTAQANVLCLARHGDGPIYAGTDTEGLIYRLTPRGGDEEAFDAYVVYDAAEPEIGALLAMADGTVYAGTADAEKARPGRLEEPEEEETGRPEEAEAAEQGEAEDAADEPDAAAADPAEADAAAEAAPEVAEPDAPAEADPGDAPAAEEAPADAEPTAEQRDALRELIRQRLLAARESGTIKPIPPRGSDGGERPTRAATAAQTGSNQGNAVYRIDPAGFVQPVFRDSVMILKLAAEPSDDGHRLLIATGVEGQVFRVEPATGETSVVLDLDPTNIPAMRVGEDGTVMLGTADAATLVTLRPGVAGRGTYTSQPLDAQQISLWGTFNLTAEVPDGASITVETRSGNLADPEAAAWSAWSQAAVFMPDENASPLAPRAIKIGSPPARFLQYRLTLTSNGEVSPAVGKAELAYVMPNLRPAVDSLQASYPEPKKDQPPATGMNIQWQTTDGNGDRLLYHLEYQPAGSEKWLTLAEELTDTSHEWDTTRVPDGRYRLRLTADDRLDNPGAMALTARRVSDPVVVDNAPPAVRDLEVRVEGRSATLSGKVADELSPINAIAYSLDEDTQYSPLLPEDLIFDSTGERFVATLPDSSPGPHVVTVRVQDARGNTAHHPVLFEIE